MPKKQNVDALLRKNLGSEVANRVIRKINKMIKEGASPAKIQKAITADLVTHVRKQAAIAVSEKSTRGLAQRAGGVGVTWPQMKVGT